MSACTRPIPWDVLVAYWANDLPEAELDQVETHLMACDACTTESESVAQLSQTLRELLPPLLRPEQVEQLRARGLVVVDNPMRPGERRQVSFPRGVDILLHRLQGLALEQAASVHFTLHDEDTGSLIAEVPDAPFDRARGEILVACQLHYAHMPPNTVAECEVRLANGDTQRTRYTILHLFP